MQLTPLAPNGAGVPSSIATQAPQNAFVPLNVVSGTVPDDLTGHVLFMAPTPRGNGTPFFNAPPVCWHLRFVPGAAPSLHASVEARGTRLETPSVIADRLIEDKRKQGALGRLAYELMRFRDVGGLSRVSWLLGCQDQANTALQPFVTTSTSAGGGAPQRTHRLLAMYDAGQPYELDATTMRLRGAVGMRESWREMPLPALEVELLPKRVRKRVEKLWQKLVRAWPFPLISSTAHPGYDRDDGVLYFANAFLDPKQIAPMPFSFRGLSILRWDGTNEPVVSDVVGPSGRGVQIEQSTHQMIVTEKHVVIIDTSFAYELVRLPWLRKLFPKLGSDVHLQSQESHGYIIEKAKLAQGGKVPCVPFTIPKDCVHFWADYAEQGTRLVLHLHHLNGHDVSEWVMRDDVMWGTKERHPKHVWGFPTGPYAPHAMGRYEVDTQTGAVVKSTVLTLHDHWGVAFGTHAAPTNASLRGERFMWLNYGGMTRELLPTRIVEAYRARIPDPSAIPQRMKGGLLRYDTENVSVVDFYVSADNSVITSLQHVPKRGATGELDAYIVAMVFTQGGADELWIFDAKQLAQGPLCRLSHPQVNFAFPLHGAWVPHVDAPPASPLPLAERDGMDDTWLSKLIGASALLREVADAYRL